MKNKVQDGNTIRVTATAAISAGDVVASGSIVGVAVTDIAQGASGAIDLKGVFVIPIASGTARTQGTPVYLASSKTIGHAASDFTFTSGTGTTLVGYVARAAASTDAEVEVLIG